MEREVTESPSERRGELDDGAPASIKSKISISYADLATFKRDWLMSRSAELGLKEQGDVSVLDAEFPRICHLDFLTQLTNRLNEVDSSHVHGDHQAAQKFAAIYSPLFKVRKDEVSGVEELYWFNTNNGTTDLVFSTAGSVRSTGRASNFVLMAIGASADKFVLTGSKKICTKSVADAVRLFSNIYNVPSENCYDWKTIEDYTKGKFLFRDGVFDMVTSTFS